MARVQFAVKMLVSRLKKGRNRCPYCESCMHFRLQRKWMLIQARKCAFCGLIFRYPTDNSDDAAAFYNQPYQLRRTRDLPGLDLLPRLKSSDFKGSPFDKSHRIRLIKSICQKGRILDYGCSWGYSVHQMIEAGFKSIGFELSTPMADYGRKNLGVDIRNTWNELLPDLSSSFDLIYTDHVLEHTYDLRQPLDAFSTLLKPSGKLVIFVPNAGGLQGRRDGVRWGAFIGEAHTIAFSYTWFKDNLPLHGFEIEELYSTSDGAPSLFDGEELVCVARRREDVNHGFDLRERESTLVCDGHR